MGGSWTILRTKASSSSFPTILIKHDVASSGYTLYLTDLSHVWVERMNAREIRRRALNADTSIDPSEDVEQMRLFLRCINDALDQKPSTSVDLAYDEPNKCLLLKTYTPLPGSLEPLQWIVEMRMASPHALTREMIVPLLHQQAMQNIESTSLVQELRDKDHVIDKLVDTMQANGVSLSSAFPSAATLKSKLKSNPRQALGKNARGLSEFDELRWRDDLRHQTIHVSSLDALVISAFQNGLRNDHEAILPPDHGEWWLHMSGIDRHKVEGHSKSSAPTRESQDSVDGPQFQVSKSS